MEEEAEIEAAKLISRRISKLLADNKVHYSVALLAMRQLMLGIAVVGTGKQEQEARKFLASLFLTDDVTQLH